MKTLTAAAVLVALDEHRENYDSDCSWHRGCSCGWVPAPTALTEWFDDDVGHPAWLAHMAEVITS